MEPNTFVIISISIPMILGFTGVVFSVISSSNAINYRLADFRADVDRRFDEQKEDMNRRFTEVDRRFDEVDRRFTEVDRRFDEVDRRFTEVDGKFDDVTKRLDEQKEEISLLGNRLNTYLDSYAIRLITDNATRSSRKKRTAE